MFVLCLLLLPSVVAFGLGTWIPPILAVPVGAYMVFRLLLALVPTPVKFEGVIVLDAPAWADSASIALTLIPTAATLWALWRAIWLA